jgi:uracil-DNA glycosylase
MAGSDTERVVYYEDLAVTKIDKENVGKDTEKDTAEPNDGKSQASLNRVESDTVPTTKTAVKRQRTLLDMLGPSEVSAKKPKLGQSASSQALNSIPFSMSTFQDSLSEEENKLLSLECETMGKSWQVMRQSYVIKSQV